METMGEIIPFAKEMLNQRPGRSMLKIYMLGSTLAVLGMVGGLVETVLLPFGEHDMMEEMGAAVVVPVAAEPAAVKLKKKTKKKQRLGAEPEPTLVPPEAEEVADMVDFEAKAKHHMMNAGRRNSWNRVHAS